MRGLRKSHNVISFQTKESIVSEVEVNSVLNLQLESESGACKRLFFAGVKMLVIQFTNPR